MHHYGTGAVEKVQAAAGSELRIFGEMRVEEDKEHICVGGGGGLVEVVVGWRERGDAEE